MKTFKWLNLFASLCIFLTTNCFAENDATQTVLPLGISPQGMPFINIQIQGKKVPVVFDTGWSKGAFGLSKLAINNVNVKYINKKTCWSTTTGKICMQNFIIPNVKLGDFALDNVEASTLTKLWGSDKGFIETQASRNGVIGIKALQNFGVLIDYPHSQIILTRNYQIPKDYDMSHWIQIPVEMKYGILTQGKINNVPVILVWDTGPNFSILKLNNKFTTNLVNCSNNVNCPHDFPKGSKQALKTDSLTFNGQEMKNTWFEVSNVPLPFDGLIASNFFKDHLVFINFKNKTLFVKN